MGDYEEGYRQGLEASRRYQEEARAYKEAYFKLLESIASMKAFDPPPPIFIRLSPPNPAETIGASDAPKSGN